MKTKTLQTYQERLSRVLTTLHERLDEDIPLEELADLAHFSPYHFHRIFHGMTGEPVKSYVRRLRLERSAECLLNTGHTVTRIAMEAGYETVEAFTRAFGQRFALSPSKYRKSNKLKPEPSAPIPPRLTEELSMIVEMKQVPPRRVAYVRHVGPYDDCGEAWERLFRWAVPRGLLGAGASFIGVCHDDPDVTPSDKIRYDACITLDEGVKPTRPIKVQEIAGGCYAVTTHVGPYATLGRTYASLCGQWAARSGKEIKSAPAFEVYLNDPENTEPEDLLTDIYLPLEEEQR